MDKYLYHATKNRDDAFNIFQNGFKTEITYFCTKPEHSAYFMKLYHGDGIYTVLEIDISKLDIDNLKTSTDHNTTIFPEDLKAFYYDGKISKEAITRDLRDIEINTN